MSYDNNEIQDAVETEAVETEKEIRDPNAFSVAMDKTKGCREVDLTYDFGDTLADSEASFGAEVVHSYWRRGAKVALQSMIRKLLVEGKTDDEILVALSDWKPGVKAKRSGGGRKRKGIEEMFADSSPEEQAAILAKLSKALEDSTDSVE